MSWFHIVDGKPIKYAQICHGIEAINKVLSSENFYAWEHPERYIELKKFLYAYGGYHPIKNKLCIEMDDQGYAVSYKASIPKKKRLEIAFLNKQYYDKHLDNYKDKNGDNNLFYYEKCCDLLRIYMKLLDKTSIDYDDDKNHSHNYPAIYTKNKLRLNKDAEAVFNGCLESWGLADTMEDYMVDPYKQFIELNCDTIVLDLTEELTKHYKRTLRQQNKRKRIVEEKEHNNELKERINNYFLEHEKKQKNEKKIKLTKNLIQYSDSEEDSEEQFSAGF
tara:strand:- start:277 stop:1107 length:831 start_codon:yes stop_codon:yes gene_type:complete